MSFTTAPNVSGHLAMRLSVAFRLRNAPSVGLSADVCIECPDCAWQAACSGLSGPSDCCSFSGLAFIRSNKVTNETSNLQIASDLIYLTG